MPPIDGTALISPGTEIGQGTTIEPYCLIGCGAENARMPDESHITKIGVDSVVRAGSYIYYGNLIGKNFTTGNKVNIREKNIIGDNVSVGTLSIVEHHVKIGNNVRIHSQAFIPEYSILEDNVWIGPNVVLTNATYPASPTTKENLSGPILKKNCKIGANVTILPGVTIGENTLVGAGSVVTKDLPDNSICYGNPAKATRAINEIQAYVQDASS